MVKQDEQNENNVAEIMHEKAKSLLLGLVLGGVIGSGSLLRYTQHQAQQIKYISSNYHSLRRAQWEDQKINSVSTRDVNSDGLADIVVERNSGDKIAYYNTGSEYLTKEQMRQREEYEVEQMKQREIERIEQSYQEQLRQTNEFYKRAYDENNLRGRE
jgi:hypothetical protein